jgi:hypothetical protein
VVNEIAEELTEETLNQLVVEDVLAEEMGQLSLNAISRTELGNAMCICALVQNKVMLILVDSHNAHSFASKSFLMWTTITSSPAPSIQVKVANRDILHSSKQVNKLEWWAQGHTFHIEMRVLDIIAYDAILGHDWLRSHSPMVCHWELKTL